MIRHIPKPDGKTYCGREYFGRLAVINTKGSLVWEPQRAEDCIEDAECKVCRRSDDRRTRDEYRKTEDYKKEHTT